MEKEERETCTKEVGAEGGAGGGVRTDSHEWSVLAAVLMAHAETDDKTDVWKYSYPCPGIVA